MCDIVCQNNKTHSETQQGVQYMTLEVFLQSDMGLHLCIKNSCQYAQGASRIQAYMALEKSGDEWILIPNKLGRSNPTQRRVQLQYNFFFKDNIDQLFTWIRLFPPAGYILLSVSQSLALL
jgi:hypothetical protein